MGAEDGFKPKHRILCQALSGTPTGEAPGLQALLLNVTKSRIADGQRIRGVLTPQSLRVAPRGNRRCRPALANAFITSPGVVGSIPRDLTNFPRILPQQPWKDPAIMLGAPGHLHRHNFFRRLVTSQMECAPDPSVTASMLVDVPLPCPVNSKTGGIHDNMTGPATW